MNLKFVLKRGKYSVSVLYCNGFRVGTLSWSMTRNDPKPHVLHIDICGEEYSEHFTTEQEAGTAAIAKCKEIIGALCGEIESTEVKNG